jgi:putative endonuclease
MWQRIWDWLSRRKGRRTAPLSPTGRLGRLGEDEAASYLKRHGYSILARNFRIAQGELDVVAYKDGTVAFVEVRAQTEPVLIDPLATITRRKQRRVAKAAQAYIAQNRMEGGDAALRFDVVTVVFDAGGRAVKVTHVEDAFQHATRAFS